LVGFYDLLHRKIRKAIRNVRKTVGKIHQTIRKNREDVALLLT